MILYEGFLPSVLASAYTALSSTAQYIQAGSGNIQKDIIVFAENIAKLAIADHLTIGITCFFGGMLLYALLEIARLQAVENRQREKSQFYYSYSSALRPVYDISYRTPSSAIDIITDQVIKSHGADKKVEAVAKEESALKVEYKRLTLLRDALLMVWNTTDSQEFTYNEHVEIGRIYKQADAQVKMIQAQLAS